MSKHVVLDTPEATFVDGLVATGRFDTTDAAVKAALGLLHERETRLSDLRDAWREGVESGGYEAAGIVFDRSSQRYAKNMKADG